MLFFVGLFVGMMLATLAIGTGMICGKHVDKIEKRLDQVGQKRPQVVEFEREDDQMRHAMELTGAVHEGSQVSDEREVL